MRTPSFAGFAPSSAAASRAKRANRKEGGRAEQLLRQLLWRRGLRFRTHLLALPGCPDIVFPRARLCVFCDGDFWHGRDWPSLQEKLAKRANPGYWIPKIQRNIERDAAQALALEAAGWTVLRLWETDILQCPDLAVSRVLEAVSRVGESPERTPLHESPRAIGGPTAEAPSSASTGNA